MPLTSIPAPRWVTRAISHPYLTDLLMRVRLRGPFSTREKVTFSIAFAAAYVFGIRWNGGMADFAVNYRAGERIVRGETLYQAADGHYMFKYFPFAALIYAPFAMLPLELAMVAWFLLSLAAFALVFRMVDRLVPEKRVPHLLVIAGAILAKYMLHELRLGQINVFVALLMIAAVASLLRPDRTRAELAAGVLTGVAVAIKPYAALMVLYLIVSFRWLSVAAAAASLAIALSIPSIVYGVTGNIDELHRWGSTLSASTPGLLTNVDNVSILAFFTKWLGGSDRALEPTCAFLAALAVLTLAVIALGWRRRDAVVLDGALVLTLIPLISPLGWDYTFLLALIAVTLIVNNRAVYPRRLRPLIAANFAVIALALYDTMGRVVYGAFMRWSVTTINFIIVVFALAYLRFRRAC
jgi:hypothetical protein